MDFRELSTTDLSVLLERAIQIATNAHHEQTSFRGRPYILHPLRVMETVAGYGECAMMVAVLHDTVEDTDITLEELVEMEFPDQVVEAVKALTYVGEKGNDDDYLEYIRQISWNEWATVVKLADLKDNLRVERLPKGKVTKGAARRMEKYLSAFAILQAKHGSHFSLR